MTKINRNNIDKFLEIKAVNSNAESWVKSLYRNVQKWTYFNAKPANIALSEDALGCWAFVEGKSKDTVILMCKCDKIENAEILISNTDEIADLDWYQNDSNGVNSANLTWQYGVVERVVKNPEKFPSILWLIMDQNSDQKAFLKEAKGKYDSEKCKGILAIESDQFSRKESEVFTFFTGAVGEVNPFLYLQGQLSENQNPFTGFNVMLLLSELIKGIELNTEMTDREGNFVTEPPGFNEIFINENNRQLMSSFKWPFLDKRFELKLDRLKELCVWSSEDAVNQFNYSYNEFLRKQKCKNFENCHPIEVNVTFYSDLMQKTQNSMIKTTSKTCKSENIMSHIEKNLGTLEKNKPLIVIGFLKKSHAPSDNQRYFDSNLKTIVEEFFSRKDEAYLVKRFSNNASMLMPSIENEKVQSNIPFAERDLFGFESIPKLFIGPGVKKETNNSNCVMVKDFADTIPNLIIHMLNNL